MTPFRRFSNNPKFTNRLRQGGLYVAVAALLATHTQCLNDEQRRWILRENVKELFQLPC